MKSAVILAAGTGSRFGTDKLSQNLLGKPVLQWSVEAFLPLVAKNPDVQKSQLYRRKEQFGFIVMKKALPKQRNRGVCLGFFSFQISLPRSSA